MKLSNAQKNYLVAKKLSDSILDKVTDQPELADDDALLNDYEQAMILVELREIELFRWAKDHAAKLCAMLGKSSDDLKSVNELFDRCISGEYVRFNVKQDLADLCIKVTNL